MGNLCERKQPMNAIVEWRPSLREFSRAKADVARVERTQPTSTFGFRNQERRQFGLQQLTPDRAIVVPPGGRYQDFYHPG